MTTSPRARRRIIIAAICLGIFTIVGFFVLPPIIKSQAEKRLSAELGRTVTIGKVHVNPYALSLTMEQLDVRRKEGSGSFLGWTRMYVNFDALGSLTGDWVLSDVELDGFHIDVGINPDGTYNFADLLAKFSPPPADPAAPPAKPMRPVRIGSLKVNSARVDFFDQSKTKPFATVLGPVTFSLTEFRTAGATGAPYHFAAVTEVGEKLAWTGTLSAEPLASVGELTLDGIVLAKYSPYYSDLIGADLVDGRLSMHGRYEIDLTAGQRAMKLLDGGLKLRNVKLLERANQEPAFELPAFDLTGVAVDALLQRASIASIQFSGGHVHVRRDPDGSINLLKLLPPPTAPAPTSAATGGPAAPAKLPQIMIGEVALKDFQVSATDRAMPRPAQFDLSGIQFSARQVTLADSAVIPIDLAFIWAPQGTVHVAGSFTLKPEITADLKTDVVAMEILPFSPYLEQFVNARITQGSVSTTNTVHVALANGQPQVTLAGDVTVDKFGLVDSAGNEDLAGFASFKLSGLKATTAPQLAISLAEVAVTAPYARVMINEDKSINLLRVMKAEASAPAPALAEAAAPTPAVAAPLPKVEIGRVVLTDGDFTYTDRSLEPHVHLAIGQFGGTVSGLSSENLAKADVELSGLVDGAGPVAITGKLDPLGATKSVDLKVDFKNVDLLPISPYTGKYAGYELARGKLFVDTKIHLEGTTLDSSNVVTMNQFTFGAATNSPDATGLPVRLGVALLKDIDGKIEIDLPVQGTLGDPNFRIGKVVMRVIVNLLTKAATSPFALLGSMFGGGGDELAFQDFAPGSSDLLPTELPKLDTMVKALTNRPGLSLGIEGSYDAAADTYELKQQKFADLVRRQIWEARHAANPNIPPPAELVISPEEVTAMVKKLFDEKFPAGTELGAAPSAPPEVTAAPVSKRPGIIRRVINLIVGVFRPSKSTAKAAPAPAVATPGPAAAAAVPAGPSLEEMTSRLADTMDVTDNDLRQLATARAQRVRDHLFRVGHIAADRLFLAQGQEGAKESKGPRVFLTLQ